MKQIKKMREVLEFLSAGANQHTKSLLPPCDDKVRVVVNNGGKVMVVPWW
ncbi:Kinesin motor domain containing protein [Sesbania bispinosa]|nr:Kinesin motor domain containing protein [Sesbania bispinosa]